MTQFSTQTDQFLTNNRSIYEVMYLANNANGDIVSTSNPLPVSLMNSSSDGTIGTISFPAEQLSAFEELMVVEPFPVIQLDSVYGIENDKLTLRQSGSGTCYVDDSDNLWTANTGITAGSIASLGSRRYIRYRPGTGTLARFTAMFTANAQTGYGVTGAPQQAGLQNAGSSYAFGFSGLTGPQANTGSEQAQFGILHRYGGRPEIRELTITTAPTGTQNISIVLNSVTYTFNITSGSAAHAAQQIAAQTYGGVWQSSQIGSNVRFTAVSSGVRSGTYSFSATGAGTLANATFSQISAGVNNTNVWTYKEDWDVPDIPLNPNKLNVFAIDFRWLGAGIVRFFMEHPTTGKMTLIHTQHWANQNVIPHLENPSLRIGYSAAINAGATVTSPVMVKGASMYGAIQGDVAQTTYSEGWYNVITGNRAQDIIHHALSIRNPFTKNNRLNTRELILQDLSMSVQGNDPVVVFIYVNPIIATGSDSLLFDYIPESNALASTTSTPTFDPAVNNPVVSYVVGINGTAQFDLLPYRITLAPGDFVTIAFLSSGVISRTATSLTWNTD